MYIISIYIAMYMTVQRNPTPRKLRKLPLLVSQDLAVLPIDKWLHDNYTC